jgi:Phosphotransferase enzyme family
VSDTHSDCVAWGERHLNRVGGAGPVAVTLVKRRAWSTVWRLERPSGLYYLKEAAPGFDVEAPLLMALCSWRPASIVELVAADAARGWVLTRDAGRMLHDVMFDDPENGRVQLRSVLMAYAEMQVDCQRRDAPPFADMLEDRSPAAMASSFAAVVADDVLLRAGGATSDDFAQRDRWVGRADQLCRDLATLGLPMTLEHGDLHTSNIMIAADGTPRIADWGDACWATPLHGLAMCMDDVAGRHRIAPDDPWFTRLTQDYCGTLQLNGSASDTHQALAVVRALVPVSGVLQWSRGIGRMTADARAIMAGRIVKHLRALV